MFLREARSHDIETFVQAMRNGRGAVSKGYANDLFSHIKKLEAKQTTPYYVNRQGGKCPLQRYTVGMRGMNHWLHTGGVLPFLQHGESNHIEFYKNHVAQMHEAIKSANPLPEHVVAYSALNSPEAISWSKSLKPNDTVNLKGVTSTTVAPDRLNSHAKEIGGQVHIAKFDLAKGMKATGFYIGGYSAHPSEQELIIRPGTKTTYSHSEKIDSPYGTSSYLHHFKVHEHEDQ